MRLRDLQLSESRVPAPGWRKNGAHKKKKTGCASRRSSPLLTEESHAHHANRWYPRSQNAILACLHTKQDLLACRHIQPFSSLFFSLRYFSILTLPSSEVKWTYVNREKRTTAFYGGGGRRTALPLSGVHDRANTSEEEPVILASARHVRLTCLKAGIQGGAMLDARLV